jgi:hypothetical protein
MGPLTFEVLPDGESWKLDISGVPEGFEPGLVRLDETSFQVNRGPFHGAVFQFDDEAGGHAGPFPFTCVEGPYQEPPGYGLSPPPYGPDPNRDDAFAQLLEQTEPGDRIEWDLPYPKHEFVRWAQRLDRFVFHSSTNADIAEFLPIRDSMELQDHGGRGNLGAVYATHDGYWSMFFAIVDREKLRGSMRNGVHTWEAADGKTTTTYQFSLEQESLAQRPFTSGAVYLLPRETFRRLPFYQEGPISDEWASEEPVRPVASLLVDPEDFPFLDQVAPHDETEFLSMFDRFREVISGATSFRESDGLAIDLAWSPEIEGSYQEWSLLSGAYLPVVEHRLEGSGSTRTLFLNGPAPYVSGVKERLEEIISAS